MLFKLKMRKVAQSLFDVEFFIKNLLILQPLLTVLKTTDFFRIPNSVISIMSALRECLRPNCVLVSWFFPNLFREIFRHRLCLV